ncbi:MAG TPA: lysylphosphatidylglycerol synthase domain-containing protein, partial [Ilumatobacteraceae bacterium]|nr:lysylphosphatidylglycerol synthase domain-containing protein [Ilumatobacteraceae bacterium]
MTTTVGLVGTALRENDRRDWQRHPVDVARLVLRLSLLGLILVLTAAFPSALTNVSADLIQLFVRMPRVVRYALVGLAQLAIVSIPVVIVVWLLRRRAHQVTALVVGAAVISGSVMVLLTDWLNRAAPPAQITDLPSSSFLRTDFPSAAYLAALVAGAAAASPMMTVYWRRVAWIAVAVTALVRLLTATQAPVSIAVTLTLGSAIGSAVLVVFGSPQRRPGSATLRAGLTAAGFDVDELGDEATVRGLRTYRGTAGGQPIEVLFLDQDDRDVELFARVIRSIRVRDVDEQRLSVKPRIRAAQLATSTSMARRSGARVPEVLSVAPAERDSAIIASVAPSGRPLRHLGSDEVTDAALDDLWRQVTRLHDGRIAHRSLGVDNLMIDGDSATIAGLDTALLASSAESRAVDRAELIVSTATIVGVDRALDAAVRSVSQVELVATLPFVQLPALPAHARKEAKKPRHFVDDLRTGLQGRLGVDDVELVELERISVAKVLSWVGFGVLAFFVLTLVSNWSDIADTMSGLDWVWVVPIVIVTMLGTVGGAMSLSGSVVRPIALGEATVIMFGQSFLNRFTPMNAGGMAMRIRYLQKGGTDATVATAAIGLTSLASGVMQVLFFAFFLLLTSSDPSGGLDLNNGGGPDFSIVAVFAGASVVAAVLVAATPKVRRWVVGFVTSTFAKIKGEFGDLARRPSKLALLFGGQAIAKMSSIVAFALSCWAFDV